MQSFGKKQKCLNLRPKLPYLGIFGLEFENNCHIWNQHPWICLNAKFYKKMPKFGTNNVLFGYFGAGIWKQYCHIWNQLPRICLIAKFCEKIKMSKFETKNALFGYFWARILKNYCHIWNQHPRICQTLKLCDKILWKYWNLHIRTD